MPVYRINEKVITRVDRRPFRLTHGPTGPPGKDGAGVNLSVDFTHSSLSSILEFGVIPTRQKAFLVHLSVTESFNSDLSLQVGTDTENSLLAQYSTEECATIREYRTPANTGAVEIIKLFPIYSVLPTAGAGNITIYSL